MQEAMNWLSGKKTYLACGLGGVLMFGSWQKWWTLPPEIYAGMMAFAIAFLRNAVAKVEGQMSDAAGQASDGGGQVAAAARSGASAAPAPPAASGSVRAPLPLILAFCLLPLAFGFPGCSTPQLAPGGAYANLGAPGAWLYGVDTVVSESYLALDGFESWELQNHATLATNCPSVEAAAGLVRTNAPQYFQDYVAARAALVSLAAGTNAPALVTTASNQVQASFVRITNLVSAASASTNTVAGPQGTVSKP